MGVLFLVFLDKSHQNVRNSPDSGYWIFPTVQVKMLSKHWPALTTGDKPLNDSH